MHTMYVYDGPDTYQHNLGRKVRADTLLLLSVLLRTHII